MLALKNLLIPHEGSQEAGTFIVPIIEAILMMGRGDCNGQPRDFHAGRRHIYLFIYVLHEERASTSCCELACILEKHISFIQIQDWVHCQCLV